jgi:hypothetical protein
VIKLRAIAGQFGQRDVKRTEIDTVGIQKLESYRLGIHAIHAISKHLFLAKRIKIHKN